MHIVLAHCKLYMYNTGTDKNNVAELADLLENYPLPFEKTTLWSNSEVIWKPNGAPATLNDEDLALSMVSAGYYW